MSREPRVLPLVVRIREQIDDVFTRYVGPIAAELCREEFEAWLEDGQVGPSALHRYISRLANYITDHAPQRAFIVEASKRIDVLNNKK